MQEFETQVLPLIQPQVVEPTKVESNYHTLYIEEVEGSQQELETNIEFEIDCPIRTANNIKTYIEIPEHKKYTLCIHEFGGERKDMHDLLHALRGGQENDLLEIRINSDGGSIIELQSIQNVISQYFKGRVTTILDNVGFSCGAMLFLMGDVKVAFEHSEMMLHQATYGVLGAMESVKQHVEFRQKSLENYFKSIVSGYFSDDEINEILSGKDLWLNVDDMVGYGILDNVIVDGSILSVNDYKRLKKHESIGLTRESFWDILIKEQEEQNSGIDIEPNEIGGAGHENTQREKESSSEEKPKNTRTRKNKKTTKN